MKIDWAKRLKKLRARQGKHDGDEKWIEVGTEVEMEHTNDRKRARKIALDHLAEDPDYYKDWKRKEKILFQPRAPKLKKALTYTGPMTIADITLASWNDYFREGGSLNQPHWLQTNRLKEIQRQYAKLASLHK